MPFYLSEYIGTGTRQDPHVPVGSDQPGWAAIDLRPDSGGLNACLLKVPTAFTDARAQFLADDKLEALTNPQKNFLQNRLGVDLSSPTLLRDIIATLLNSPPANGWKALRPGFLKWEIYLGELIWEAPRISGGATDDFNRANGLINVGVPAWTLGAPGSGNISVSGNTAVAVSGDCWWYYAGAATTDDQYAQDDITESGGNGGGPAIRMQPGNVETLYFYDEFSTDGFYKFVNSSYSVVGAQGSTKANPVRVEAEGSTMRLFFNGVEDANSPWTDTSIPSGGQPGMFIYAGSQDNWSGGDLAPAVEKQTSYYSRRRYVRR